jgi:hypothetical protein
MEVSLTWQENELRKVARELGDAALDEKRARVRGSAAVTARAVHRVGSDEQGLVPLHDRTDVRAQLRVA